MSIFFYKVFRYVKNTDFECRDSISNQFILWNSCSFTKTLKVNEVKNKKYLWTFTLEFTSYFLFKGRQWLWLSRILMSFREIVRWRHFTCMLAMFGVNRDVWIRSSYLESYTNFHIKESCNNFLTIRVLYMQVERLFKICQSYSDITNLAHFL